MNHFPTEIVSSILHHLEDRDLFTCTLVNHRFYTMVNPLLWRTIWIKSMDAEQRFFVSLATAQHSVGHIRCINLEYFSWTDETLLLLMTQVDHPHLEELWLRFTKDVSDHVMHQLLQHYPNLKLLHLRQCRFTPSTWYMLGARGVLKALHLERCSGVPPDMLASLRLEELWLELSNDDEVVMMDETIKAMDGLKHLQITGNPSVDVVPRLLDPPCWPHLTALILDEGKHINNDVFLAFLQSHRKLRTLHLRDAPIEDSVLDTMATCLPDLSIVKLRRCRHITHHGLRRLIQRGGARLRDVLVLNCGIHKTEFPEVQMHAHWGMIGPLGAVWLKQDTIRNIRQGNEQQ